MTTTTPYYTQMDILASNLLNEDFHIRKVAEAALTKLGLSRHNVVDRYLYRKCIGFPKESLPHSARKKGRVVKLKDWNPNKVGE